MAKRNLAALLAVLLFPLALSAQTSPFKIIDKPTPTLPEDYGMLDVQGTIILRVKFLRSGSVGDVAVVKGLPTKHLVQLAIDAAKKIKFEPLMIDGKTVDTTKQIEYSYHWGNGGWGRSSAQTSPFKIIDRPPPNPLGDSGMVEVIGKVILRVKFLGSGQVGDVTVILGLPESRLVEFAIDAARRIKFEPAIVDGKSVDTARQVEYIHDRGGWLNPNSKNVATSSNTIELESDADVVVLCQHLKRITKIPYEKGETTGDPIYDGLIKGGHKSIPCLIDKITDVTVIKDPRDGDPHIHGFRAGDAAVFLLLNITGIQPEIMLPADFAKFWETEGIYSYFAYVERLSNRKRLQLWWKDWMRKNGITN